jgi:hypothetical protein
MRATVQLLLCLSSILPLVMHELSLVCAPPQWFAALPPVAGFVLNKNETPFARLTGIVTPKSNPRADARNHKSQAPIPKKSQFSMIKPMRAGSIRFEIWVLVLVWGLGFGLWSL